MLDYAYFAVCCGGYFLFGDSIINNDGVIDDGLTPSCCGSAVYCTDGYDNRFIKENDIDTPMPEGVEMTCCHASDASCMYDHGGLVDEFYIYRTSEGLLKYDWNTFEPA
ncbi:hypothetical protein AGMMS50229_21370 [Campylobacterota bacterium]|nr:hypothetical protein AGMMS50229_21370 [Campylobacterota bacterium]